MTERTDMRVIHLEDIGPHYATTLRHWHDRFFARLDEVRLDALAARADLLAARLDEVMHQADPLTFSGRHRGAGCQEGRRAPGHSRSPRRRRRSSSTTALTRSCGRS